MLMDMAANGCPKKETAPKGPSKGTWPLPFDLKPNCIYTKII